MTAIIIIALIVFLVLPVTASTIALCSLLYAAHVVDKEIAEREKELNPWV